MRKILLCFLFVFCLCVCPALAEGETSETEGEAAGAEEVVTEDVQEEEVPAEEESGSSRSEEAFTLLQNISDVVDHPVLTTNFEDYTVTEGFLLLAFIGAVIYICIAMIKRGFSWLL